MANVAVDTTLCISDVNVHMGKTRILKDVSFTACSGSLMAMMGPTGSGKTTLLNTIAGKETLSSGKITLSGVPFDKQLRRRLGFVLQQDTFFSSLTLWETLYFTAMIRLPDHMPKQEKLARIDEIVDVLDMRDCLHTVVGDTVTRGLSGGEKKRASIGCELLTDPDILLLDEPTSGLDSYTAYLLMGRIKEYTTKYNKTVVMAIHQPSSRIYHMFDSLMLLAKGQVVYLGGAGADPLQYFACHGLVCELNYNPADFLLEVLTSEKAVVEKIITPSVTSLSRDINKDNGIIDPRIQTRNLTTGVCLTDVSEQQIDLNNLKKQKWPTSFTTQFRMLTWRNFKETRSRIIYIYDFVYTVLIAVIMGLVFFQISKGASSFRDRMGLIYMIMTSWQTKSSTEAIMAFSIERTVISKERSAGAYRLSAYYLAKTFSELPLIVLMPSLSWTIAYWMAGLSGVSEFFATWAILVLSVFNAQGAGLLTGAIVMNVRLSMVVILFVTMYGILLSGFITFTATWWIQWAKYLSIIQYPISAISIVIFQNIEPVPCNTTGMTIFPKCLVNASDYVTSGDMLLEAGIVFPIYFYVLLLAAMFMILRIFAYLALRFKQGELH